MFEEGASVSLRQLNNHLQPVGTQDIKVCGPLLSDLVEITTKLLNKQLLDIF